MLRVLALTPQPVDGAAGRYRVHQWCEPLRALGVELEVAPFFDDAAWARLHARGRTLAKAADLARLTARRVRDLARAGRHDVAFVHRELWPLAGHWPLDVLRARQPRWVFDLDDAVFLPNVSDANRRLVALKAHGSAAALAAGAATVTAGNAWLADWARTQRPGRAPDTVRVVPTSVDADAWRPVAHDDDGTLRLLWIGSPSTARYLRAWGPALQRLAQRRTFELHVVGAAFPLPGVTVVEHAWSLATERAIAARAHIGLAPLADGDWERGKCGLKLLLAMALGLPAVASDAGVHAELLDGGACGVLVRDEAAAEHALDRLLADPAERTRLGRAARATLEARYSVRAVAPRLADALRTAAEAA